MLDLLHAHFTTRIHQYIQEDRHITDPEVLTKIHSFDNRNVELVKVTATIRKVQQATDSVDYTLTYQAHLQYLLKQRNTMYIEEEIQKRRAVFKDNQLYIDIRVEEENQPNHTLSAEQLQQVEDNEQESRATYHYNRLRAVQYAEKWWNDTNPAYESFENDCSNYISQCLRAGGAVMRGQYNRSKGWWLEKKNWSYSWAVAHSLNLYLKNSTTGLRTKRVEDATMLKLGDVICYDFQGDGRFDHSTIVTGFDENGQPLVNAHTSNSRKRFWKYEDSTAYTPNIQYHFYSIVDDSE